MNFLKLITISFLMCTSLFGFTNINQETVLEDYKNGNIQKYQNDNLSKLSTNTLVSRGMINNTNQLTRDIPIDMSKEDIKNHLTCSFVGNEWTATIYEINPETGTVSCMISKKGDLYNPVGTFNTFYPNLKKKFELDLVAAELENKSLVDSSSKQFAPLEKRVKDIYNSTIYSNNGKEYLSIPQMLTAAILTDTDIIDIEATQQTNTLQLKTNYASKYYDSGSQEFIDNKDYIVADTETIFKVYTGLSDVSMVFLILLVTFFGIWGVGGKVLGKFANKAEEKQDHDVVSKYVTGIIAGVLLFFPSGFNDEITGSNGSVVAEYNVMKTKYQEFEKDGYNLFGSWADAAAKVIIDAEVSAIIKKSGVATKDQIISSFARAEKQKNLEKLSLKIWEICRQDMYNYNGLFDANKKHQYSQDPNVPFPTSEKYAYVNSKLGSNTSSLYYSKANGEVKSSSSYNQNVLSKVNAKNPVDNYYPEYSLSSCGKNYYLYTETAEALEKNIKQQDSLLGNSKEGAEKIEALENIIKFQYELYRDWGYLAILGLPVTKLQTEYIGGLYKTNRSGVLEELNKDVKKDSLFMHSVLSAIPYLFIPGTGTLFQVISENSGKLGVAAGAAAGAAAGGGIFSWLTGSFGSVIGGAVGTVTGGATGLYLSYNVAKSLLELTPIIGLVTIGLLRFVIIMIKIFSFHFASLFMMPIMFAKENVQAISRFTMKIFSTMLELPIFVLGVWLAMTASSLIHTIGDVFGKKIIIGMLANNDILGELNDANNGWIGNEWTSKLKIYLFDGFMEITIAVFSIIIIYKILVSLHSTLFEVLEIQGSKELDNAIESIKNESSGWGNRI